MRKVTKTTIACFIAGIATKQGNTTVEVEDGITKLKLFGNLIAKIEHGHLYITNAGWFSNTTKDRLNALPKVSIYQKKGVWYLNGKEWDGEMIEIKNSLKLADK